MCGRPSTPLREGFFLCTYCLQRYNERFCSRCGTRVVELITIEQSCLCWLCELQTRIDSLPIEQLESIRQLAKSGQRFEAIKEVKRLLDVSIGEAAFLAGELAK
jgi:hypothetical protein